MGWSSPDWSALLPLVGDTWSQSTTALAKGGLTDRFECDYEVRFALFLAENMDGLSKEEEKHFLSLLTKSFHWSPFHLRQLEQRIHQQPNFDLEQITRAVECQELGEVIYLTCLIMCLVDGDLTADEKRFLQNLRARLFHSNAAVWAGWDLVVSRHFGIENEHRDFFVMPSVEPEVKEAPDLEDVLQELEGLTGLSGVKEEVRRLISFLEIQKQREGHDLPTTPLSLHMVFTGSPGTGKTTVARIVARILHALGILKKGHLVETDRSGLVGQYVGHTETKTNAIVDQALDGILFIDEAYALVKGSENDFGQEAIDTLVKRIEDDRHRLVVIVAGYQAEMEEFLKANTGLRSRFATFIEFKDFNGEELQAIFEAFGEKHHYRADPKALPYLKEVFEEARQADTFGNGRFIRNLFEGALRYQAFRLSQKEGTQEREQLMTLTKSDLQQAYEQRKG